MHDEPAGYALLMQRFGLAAIPNWHLSAVGARSAAHTTEDGRVETAYPSSYRPGCHIGDHLEFALKYDGVNLGILAALFEAAPADDLTAWIASKPTGKYTRRIWFLYEFLTRRELPLRDLARGNYVDLLEPELYHTSTPGRRSRRHRVVDNLLGGPAFCPIVRRTERLVATEKLDLRARCEELVATYPPELLARALRHLYGKETRSSFDIEHIKPDSTRTDRFIRLLESAAHRDFCDKASLVDAQNAIVDPRFRDADYRTTQNYVGENVSFQRQHIHYVAPRPRDLPDLMGGLLAAHGRMREGGVHPIVHAAVVAYGFVFLHPFEDGNGRLHRFLIHNILSLRGVVPPNTMFPVSAAMKKDPARYDGSLEAFSRPLLPLLSYDLDDDGLLTVRGDTARFYRFLDMTPQAEALADFVQRTVEHELVEELDFLANYDRIKEAIQVTVDMPDRLIDLFIRLTLQNHGRLSPRKRRSHFDFLTDDELTALELAVSEEWTKR